MIWVASGVALAAVASAGWMRQKAARCAEESERLARDVESLQRRIISSRKTEDSLDRDLEEANHRAGAAKRTKSAFLSNMSHELRTPLNAIIGYSELLLEDLEGDPREDVRRIRGSAYKLLAFVGDVLELAKMEVGDIDLVLSRISFVDLVRETVEFHREAVEARGNELEFRSIGVEPQLLFTDPNPLRLALDVLLDNAARFTSDGKIRVEVSNAMRDGRIWWRAVVSDTGCGMDEPTQDRLFEPFASGDSGVTMAGAGLGLPRAQRFLQLLGGDLFVTSVVDEGSKFTLEVPELDEEHRSLVVSMPPTAIDSLAELPAHPDASTEAVVSAIALQAGVPQGPVLLVEDDPDTRRLLAKALRWPARS